jgi:nucleotide-binding universal stress UspA family protein
MAFKDILVHVDTSPAASIRLETAIGMAEADDGHVIGLYVSQPIIVPGYVNAQLSPEIIEAHRKAGLDAVAHAEATFKEAVRRSGVSAEWRYAEGDRPEMLALNARYCDVTVVGQHDPQMMSDGLPDRFILSAGRPTLVVPYEGSYPKVGKVVLVAWDASRLAARAVNDALPLLTDAREVHVIAINPKGGTEAHGEVPCADICLHLARHKVKAIGHTAYAEDMEAGALLLARLGSLGADLLVMGGYGHARWRELVMGGMTRHVLANMPVPVLMSH